MCVSQHNTKDLLPVTFEESFKCLLVSVLGSNNKCLFQGRITQASNVWFCFVVHSGLPISYVPAKGEKRLSLLPSPLHLR
jgi:hypothetical protein